MTQEKEMQLNNVFGALEELSEDTAVPRNVKNKVELVKNILKESSEVSIRIDKAINELEEAANDTNMQAFTRTQIWNLISLLESNK